MCAETLHVDHCTKHVSFRRAIGAIGIGELPDEGRGYNR